ncbi:MAG TPA: condensation domain-containing protein, partial [Pseudonocardiaceae bacterium]|nr:condensation domain-containing protein [Pseudonocardiaceae bacterium]
MDRILVPFQGEGDGVDELPWGQVALWHGMSLSGRSVTLAGVSPAPPDATVEDMVDMLGFVVGRHQALRTRLRLRPGGRPLQVCVTSGEVPLDVVDIDADEDPAEIAKAVKLRYQETNFDYENEFPVRMAVIRQHGRIALMVAVYLHLALDAGGLAALLADIAGRDPVTGAAAGPVTGITPLEQARKQRTPHALRKSETAMVYLEHALRTMHHKQFGEPRYKGDGWLMLRFRSPATALAVRRISRQQDTSTSSALLAAFAVAVARFTGIGRVMTWLSVGNRFRPGFADTVSAVAQLSPYLIEVDDVSLGEAVARARTSV